MENTEINTSELIKGIIGSVVRFALGGAVGWLINKGVVTGEQGSSIIPAITIGAITLAWAVWRKWRIQKRISVALALQAGSSQEKLDRAVKEAA